MFSGAGLAAVLLASVLVVASEVGIGGAEEEEGSDMAVGGVGGERQRCV